MFLKADYKWLDENAMDHTLARITKFDLYLCFDYPRVRCNLKLVTPFVKWAFRLSMIVCVLYIFKQTKYGYFVAIYKIVLV